MNNAQSTSQKVVAWARPVYARPVNAPDTGELDELVDIEFHNRPEKPEGEGWYPLVVADTGRQNTHSNDCWSCGHGHYECAIGKIERLQAEIEALRADRDALLDALAQQPAAVDEAMVFRLAVWMAKHDGCEDPHRVIYEGGPPVPWGEVWNRYEYDARAALTAALAAQQQEPTT